MSILRCYENACHALQFYIFALTFFITFTCHVCKNSHLQQKSRTSLIDSCVKYIFDYLFIFAVFSIIRWVLSSAFLWRKQTTWKTVDTRIKPLTTSNGDIARVRLRRFRKKIFVIAYKTLLVAEDFFFSEHLDESNFLRFVPDISTIRHGNKSFFSSTIWPRKTLKLLQLSLTSRRRVSLPLSVTPRKIREKIGRHIK